MNVCNKEDVLWTDLSAIDARRELLREALKKLKLTLKTIKSSLVQNSGIDVRQNIFLNSLNKLVYRKPRNKRDRLGHMRYPEPGYTLYKEKQADNRNFQKEDENKLSSFGT